MKRSFFAPAAIFTLFLFSHPLLGQVPNNGQTLVLKLDNGMRLIRFFGDASIKGFFPGQGFTWVEANEHNPDPTFWIGDMLIQWMLVDRSDFMAGAATNEHETLEAYYRYETDYLKQIRPAAPSRLHLERFQFTGEVATDGVKHTFLIWSAFPGGDKTKQYWIATVHPLGTVTMSIVPKSNVAEQAMKTLIDSYMASYAILRPDEARTALGQFRTLNQTAGPSKVPSVVRKPGDKPGEDSIPAPQAGSSPTPQP
jgi:hypothetical protein